MIGFAFMISGAHNELGWTRNGARCQERSPGLQSLQRGRLQRWKLCSTAAPCLMSEITHQNNQTFTNSPPTGNNSAVKLAINQMCAGQIVGCRANFDLFQVSTCVNLSGNFDNKSIHGCWKVLHCLQFINDINFMDYLSQPGRPSSALLMSSEWVSASELGPAALLQVERSRAELRNVNMLGFLSAPGPCPTPLYLSFLLQL